jgi:hypothetical protein
MELFSGPNVHDFELLDMQPWDKKIPRTDKAPPRRYIGGDVRRESRGSRPWTFEVPDPVPGPNEAPASGETSRSPATESRESADNQGVPSTLAPHHLGTDTTVGVVLLHHGCALPPGLVLVCVEKPAGRFHHPVCSNRDRRCPGPEMTT